jgi:hypothetical protein
MKKAKKIFGRTLCIYGSSGRRVSPPPKSDSAAYTGGMDHAPGISHQSHLYTTEDMWLENPLCINNFAIPMILAKSRI